MYTQEMMTEEYRRNLHAGNADVNVKKYIYAERE